VSTVKQLVEAMESIAPLHLAAEWDNVGLLIGSRRRRARRVLLTIDFTESVLDEAVRQRVEAIVAYHPPILPAAGGLRSVTDNDARGRLILACARAGIAAYSPHTALDAAEGGLNEWLAAGLGPGEVAALQPHGVLPESEQVKIITFAPPAAIDPLREAMGESGAGRIGAYEQCSFEITGTGTFRGGKGTNPAVGRAGRLERVEEVRLEMACSRAGLVRALDSLRAAHPYEEPAIEVHPLAARPKARSGECWAIEPDRPPTLKSLVQRVKKNLGVKRVLVAAPARAPASFRRIAVCAGSGGSVLSAAINQGCAAFVTGELKHHEVLSATARGCTIILAGHTNTERPFLPILQRRLRLALPGVTVLVSRRDRDPLTLR
jgi:dinuclear metal center YbgI/SA1388 family protein